VFRSADVKIAAGFVVVVAGSFLATQFPPSQPAQRSTVLAAVVAAFAAVAGNVLVGLATAGMAWLFCNGFLVDRLGELHWHGRDDAVRLAAFGAAGLVGGAAGWAARVVRSAWRRWSTVPHPASGAAPSLVLPPGVPANARIVPPSPAYGVHSSAPGSTANLVEGSKHG
jgi:MFS family permease